MARLHRWDLSPSEAIVLQKHLAEQHRRQKRPRLPVRPGMLIAGTDVSYNKFNPRLYAAVVVLRVPDLEIVETRTITATTSFPYIPGLLSFRETPPVLDAFNLLRHKPDVVMFDGQGCAHPRRFGIACHAGLWLDLPTFGCAKSRLVGQHDSLPVGVGAHVPLFDKGEQVGLALRTKPNCNPVFVSVGHRMRLDDALAWTLAAGRGYRIPEPTRQAHLAVNVARLSARTT